MFRSFVTILARMFEDASKNLYKLSNSKHLNRANNTKNKQTTEQSKVVVDIAKKLTPQKFTTPLIDYHSPEEKEKKKKKKDTTLMNISVTINGGDVDKSYKSKLNITTNDFMFGGKVYQELKHIFTPIAELNQISMMENVGQGYQFTVFDIDTAVEKIDLYIYDLVVKTCKNSVNLDTFRGYFIINHEYADYKTDFKFKADRSLTIDEPSLFKEVLEIAITQTDDAWDNFYNTMSLISKKMTQCGYGEAMKTFNTALNTFNLNRHTSSYSSDKYSRNNSYITTRIYS